jgi:hypothetical protein
MMKNAIILTILLAAIPCSAAIITVEPDGSGDAPTIQDAVDIAGTGDEIVLAIGTYTGNGNRDIDFGGRSITVRSTNPNDPCIVAATIIDCEGDPWEPHRGFSFTSGEDANSIVSGLTVTNGFGPYEELCGSYSVGGAIYCHSSSPTVTNCAFTDNMSSIGGGMYNLSHSSPTVTNCIFTGNSTEYNGGGMYNEYYSSPTVTNCTFGGNTAYRGGGMYNRESSPTVTNCTFTGNTAWDGGGMCNWYGSNPIVTNCTFGGNSADDDGGGMCNVFDSSPIVDSCAFTDNLAGSSYNGGGGMYNHYSDPMVTNCTFGDNSAYRSGGGMCNDDSSPIVTNCTFGGNTAWDGGGMENWKYSSPTVTNCTFSGNSADGYGGGMYNYYFSSPTVTNCTFGGNLADYGGGMCNWSYSSPTVTNCIFTGNSANYGGGMGNYYYSSPTVTNCIIWGNTASYGSNEIFGSASVSYSCVRAGHTGTGNIDANPFFVNAADGDYHLLADSPCIDTGDPNYILDPNYPADLDGNPRIVDGDYDGIAVVDMGAFEVQPDPIELLDMLAFDIIELGLRRGIENSLLAKIDAAIAKLEDDNPKNDKAAITSLQALINVVEAQSGKKIAEEDAAELIETAQRIIDMLTSG